MSLQRIEIRNFRGLRNLLCDSLSRITLIGGRNNCGKSSVLEAIHLLHSSFSGATLARLNQTRQQAMRKWTDLETAYTNADFSSPIVVSGVSIDGRIKRVSIAMNVKRAAEYSADEGSDDITYRRELVVTTEEGGERYQSRFFRAKANKHGTPGTFSEDTWVTVDNTNHQSSGVYVTAHSRSNVVMNELDAIVRQKRVGGILAVLQEVDSRINGITISDDEVLVDVEGVTNLLPIKMLGDGMMRIISILVSIERCQDGGVVCIDEIDNGLHYSAYLTLLHAMVRFAEEKNVQLIVTTHNREFMQRISNDEESCELLQRYGFSYLNLIRFDSGELEAVHYTLDQFTEAVQNGMEVR